MEVSAPDSTIIKRLADALVANYKGVFQLFCGRCWKEARINSRRESCIDELARVRTAQQFFEIGWRYGHSPLCPKCDKAAQSVIE